MSAPWIGRCTRCDAEDVEVASRRGHGERVLCSRCDAKPHQPPSANGLDAPTAVTVASSTAARRVELTPASAIRSERLHWVWTGRMPRRSLVVVAGEKRLGKSLLTNARLPALMTRGTLDGELHGAPADVLVVTAEDDWASVVKPRLVAHGADLKRVHRVVVQDDSGDSLLTLPDDVPRLEQQIVQLRDMHRPVAMLVVDPIGAFLAAGTDTHRDASVRRALAPLAAMAERLNLVIVVVAHLTKDESGRLINRVSGAGAFVNAARSVLALARDPGDPNGEQGNRRVLLHVGSNWGTYAPTLAWQVEGRQIEVDDGSTADVGYLVDKGETSVGVEDVQRGPDENGSDAEEAIGAALAAGPRPSREVKAEISPRSAAASAPSNAPPAEWPKQAICTSRQGGFPRTTTWTLASRATAASTVTPSPNTNSGVTGSYAVVTDDSASSDANGATPASNVATAEEEAPLARARSLVEEGAS